MSVAYEAGRVPSVGVSCAIFAAALWVGVFKVRLSRTSLLTRYVLLLYSLPFVHCLEYLRHDYSYFSTQRAIWGLTATPYQSDPRIIEGMTFVGAIGALALVAGMRLARGAHPRPRGLSGRPRTLTLAGSTAVAALALLFSWASAPTQTVFEAIYTQGVSPLEGTNFNAAYLVSYVFAAILLIDALQERRPNLRVLKFAMTVATLAIIVVWFQFLRGDRECMGLVAAALALVVMHPGARGWAGFRRRYVGRMALATLAVLVIVGAAQVVGSLRSRVQGRELADVLEPSEVAWFSGTWSAVLRTPLSVVGDAERGLMPIRWGQTYVDYFLSIPPGFIAQALGYERPIEGTHGPAWEMRYGLGGTHLLVVPFMNFRTPGVVGILLIYGWIVGFVERRASEVRMKPLLWYATFLIVGPFWIWYGEMSLVRGVMTFYVGWLVYRLLPKLGPKAVRVDLPGDLLTRQSVTT